MSPSDANMPTTPSSMRKNADDSEMDNASLEFISVSNQAPRGPATYTTVYTRCGWSWRTHHRYSECLTLKNTLQNEFGSRSLPDEAIFPQKEGPVAVVSKVLNSCQGCRGGSNPEDGFLEGRRLALQMYFSEILMRRRKLWDSSDDIKRFFSPGSPTSYRPPPLSTRASDDREEGNETRSPSAGRLSLGTSFRSKVGGMFETSPKSPQPLTPGSSSGDRSRTTTRSQSARSTRLSLMSAFSNMPSLESMLFDGTPPASSRHGGGNSSINSGSRHKVKGGSVHSMNAYVRPGASSTHKTVSESGTTQEPDVISDGGGSRHSIWD